ncbi:ImmA/IrrE family metallo-endopeptidase [Thermoanaerobacterium thermosaccharolyticum]|jgi:Zn-dependent peptidase ImmA (M78 family)|nr:ImmA/IrrE family metallo-endopeptidase [Thermoanaerobacterium thermosaccharolyticum]
MAQKANKLLLKYNIVNFPINIDIIEYIIENEGLEIEFTSSIKKAVIIDNTIYMNKPDNMSDYRSFVIHEYGHYTYQCGNIEYLSNKNKYEMKAQAFAAYFLMPIGVFEKHLELNQNDYELSHDFGVTLELIKFRKDLTKALIDSGEYNLLVYSLYFNKNDVDNIIDYENIYLYPDNPYEECYL